MWVVRDKRKSRAFGWMLTCILILIPAPTWAQTAAPGMIAGHVSGPRGVPVPGATVLIFNHQSGQQRKTWTDKSGNYQFSGVAPGTYSIDVSLVGFGRVTRDNMILNPGAPTRADVTLNLSNPAEQSTGAAGNGAGTPLQGTKGTASSVAAQTTTAPQGAEGGVSATSKPAKLRFSKNNLPRPPKEPRSDFAEDMSASDANAFLLSGNVVSAPAPEEVQAKRHERVMEIRRAKSQRTAPGFSSGSNQPQLVGGHWTSHPARVNGVRGNLFDEFSNSALDANPYPLNTAQSPQIPSNLEHFAFSLGGPVVLPHIYNGRDKTTFYVHYNLQRSKNPFDAYSTVPTLAERQGNFSNAIIPAGPFAGTTPLIYDPNSNPLGPRTPFPGNQIPAPRLSPIAGQLMNFIPRPNLPGNVQNFHLQQGLPSAHDRVMARIIHQFSARDSLSVFYYLNSSRSNVVFDYPGLTQNRTLLAQNLNLTETHTFNSHTVNTAVANFNRERINTLNPFAFNQNIVGGLGIQGVSQLPMDWGVPWIDFTNFNALNDVIPALIRNQTFRASDTLLVNRGAHNLKMGGEWRNVQLNSLTDPNARGTFIFSGYSTSNFTATGTPVNGTGFDFADFLLGLPQTTSVRFGTSSNYFRARDYAAFLEDDWKARPRLTLNLGLRYEYFQPFSEKYGHLANLTLGQGFTTAGVVTGQSPGSLPTSLIYADPNDLAPRVGLAFRPWSKHGLVVRAGYGIFYDQSIYQLLVPFLANEPPFAQASTLVTSPSAVLTLANGFPASQQKAVRNTYAVDPHYLTPYAQTWNFMLEDQIATNLIFTLGYIGTRGTHLNLLLAPNSAPPGSSTNGLRLANALPFIYDTSGAASNYEALQTSLRRQFHNGLSFDVNYTYSKAMDNAATVGGFGNIVAQDAFNLAAEYGLSAFNTTHRLLVDDTYELPFGPRRRYLNNGSKLARIFGNWQISGVTTVQSGFPYTAYILGNISNNVSGAAPFSSLRAQATGLPAAPLSSSQSTLQFFNTAAFTLPPAGQYGDAGRNTIPGPDLVNFNISLDRFLTLSEKKNITGDFRIEADNVFNTANFNGLGTVINAANYGRVTSVFPMRTLMVSIRVQF